MKIKKEKKRTARVFARTLVHQKDACKHQATWIDVIGKDGMSGDLTISVRCARCKITLYTGKVEDLAWASNKTRVKDDMLRNIFNKLRLSGEI
jgi:hypothetical protein